MLKTALISPSLESRFAEWLVDSPLVQMNDIVTPEKRSQMMAGISSRNTQPELIVRKGLHARGFRYSLHTPQIVGKPDIFLRKHGVCIYVHGCFWHAHNCKLFKMPKSRTEFWKAKFDGNMIRDKRNLEELLTDGYRVAVVWECALKNKTTIELGSVLDHLGLWIRNRSIDHFLEISDGIVGK